MRNPRGARRLASGVRLLLCLSPSERAAVRLAWREMLMSRLRLRFPRALGGARAAFEDGPGATRLGEMPAERLLKLFRMAERTHVHAVSCLPRALALKRVLRRYGADVRLRLGMKRTPKGWAGHAWLERDGAVFGDREDFVRTFVPLRESP